MNEANINIKTNAPRPLLALSCQSVPTKGAWVRTPFGHTLRLAYNSWTNLDKKKNTYICSHPPGPRLEKVIRQRSPSIALLIFLSSFDPKRLNYHSDPPYSPTREPHTFIASPPHPHLSIQPHPDHSFPWLLCNIPPVYNLHSVIPTYSSCSYYQSPHHLHNCIFFTNCISTSRRVDSIQVIIIKV